jgi:Mg2+/citrate symporter
MFTQGRIYFVILFVIAFVIALIISYRKEIRQRRYIFKGSKKIVIIIIAILILLTTFIRLLKYV